MSPAPGKSVNFEDLLLICTVFPHFGRKTKFCGQEFYGHPDLSEKKGGGAKLTMRCWGRGAHQGGHATARFLEGFLEGSLKEVPS